MEEMLTVQIPSAVRKVLNRTPEEMGRDLKLYTALKLFELGKLSSGIAAEMAGIPRVQFFDLCAEYGISVSQITPEHLHSEIENDEQASTGL